MRLLWLMIERIACLNLYNWLGQPGHTLDNSAGTLVCMTQFGMPHGVKFEIAVLRPTFNHAKASHACVADRHR